MDQYRIWQGANLEGAMVATDTPKIWHKLCIVSA